MANGEGEANLKASGENSKKAWWVSDEGGDRTPLVQVKLGLFHSGHSDGAEH